jgi:hypothetical protein
MQDRALHPITPDMAGRIFAVVKDSAVLVGGQSLAFWVSAYDVPVHENMGAISMDVDYLGQRDIVTRLGKAFNSIVIFPAPEAITALVGNVHIILDDGSYMNIDVIHRIVGLRAKDVWDRSIVVDLHGHPVRVMHPLHVLRSRVINLYRLANRQNANGVMQASLAIEMVRRYIADVARNMEDGQRVARKQIEEVVDLAKSSAGRYAKLNGLNFFGAIPISSIESPGFHAKRLPRLLDELAAAEPQKNRERIDR